MRQELDEALCRDFPILYQDRHRGMQETCMCWGFDVPDTWYGLIRRLSEKIEALNQTLPEDERIVATQVKEKYGTLRFYVNWSHEVVNSWIAEAELESGHVCEICGAPGKTGGRGWVETLCKQHRRERKQRG